MVCAAADVTDWSSGPGESMNFACAAGALSARAASATGRIRRECMPITLPAAGRRRIGRHAYVFGDPY
jgi:hypothetical protein